MPTPPPFPFRRAGRVVYSARGLYVLAALIAVFILGMGALAFSHAERNTTATIAVLCCILGVLLVMAGWCAYCGRRVQLWEREYERVMGRKFGA